jgi:iron(III) transport system substrate-binding protein
VPKQFKDPHGRWCSNALRARVMGVHRQEKDFEFNPFTSRLEDLTKPEFKDRIAMAKPTAGTTGGHVAALYVLWGDEKAKAYFRRLRDNGIKLLGGNAKVAEAVGQGSILAGLTDNDDVVASKANGGKIEAVLPDQAEGGIGTLMVPTTVGIIARERRPQAAQKLVDYLLSRETEQKLIAAGFAGWSVRELEAAKVKAMNVDYAKVAEALPRATREATSILEGRE